jgi:hypothetical protein
MNLGDLSPPLSSIVCIFLSIAIYNTVSAFITDNTQDMVSVSLSLKGLKVNDLS